MVAGQTKTGPVVSFTVTLNEQVLVLRLAS